MTLGGSELLGLPVPAPAASIRLLIPTPGAELVLPKWNGNEFVLRDGSRPVIRTLTPRRFDARSTELDVEIVVHGRGAASRWALEATPGSTAAVSGPGRGYEIDRAASRFFLLGDETALPAISQLLEVLPREIPVTVHLSVASDLARVRLPGHSRADVSWDVAEASGREAGELLEILRMLEPDPAARWWIAGEAAAVQRCRNYLFEQVRVPRASATVRGYWKRGRAGDGEHL